MICASQQVLENVIRATYITIWLNCYKHFGSYWYQSTSWRDCIIACVLHRPCNKVVLQQFNVIYSIFNTNQVFIMWAFIQICLCQRRRKISFWGRKLRYYFFAAAITLLFCSKAYFFGYNSHWLVLNFSAFQNVLQSAIRLVYCYLFHDASKHLFQKFIICFVYPQENAMTYTETFVFGIAGERRLRTRFGPIWLSVITSFVIKISIKYNQQWYRLAWIGRVIHTWRCKWIIKSYKRTCLRKAIVQLLYFKICFSFVSSFYINEIWPHGWSYLLGIWGYANLSACSYFCVI